MSTLRYTKPELITLHNHSEFNEKWLQDLVSEDPSILGLGEVEIVERERRHERAGRLDFLLYDRNENCRYEVELMLGSTDESHIVRAVEYWDIERRRYPGYDHCAVIVAEDITSRFLNVLGLFAGSIPFIALQLSALKVGDQIVLNFVRVLDRASLRIDDQAEIDTEPKDRNYWNTRGTPQTVEIADTFLALINNRSAKQFRLNYNKYYIGLTDGTRSRNFTYFQPKKQFTYVMFVVSDGANWVKRLKDESFSAGVEDAKRIWLQLKPSDMPLKGKLIEELVTKAVEQINQV